MRRFYSTFPGGLPGAGLLLLRAAVGGELMLRASACMSESHGMLAWLPCLAAFLIGLSFLTGFFTRPIGILIAGIAAAVGLLHPAWGHSIATQVSFNGIVIVIALCFLGPGAFSLDAHFFGRRKIVIPRAANS